MVYKCHRCFYLTNNKKDMRKHLSRKNKCKRVLESYMFTDDDIEKLSFEKINNDEIAVNKEYSKKNQYLEEVKKNNFKT